ncbi:hypothetical protein [Pseudomonas putida]|uniref:hypothetical protein n=1 Tax=Pseudomonas putida TaxID=303 RepID=UPI00300EBCE0
MNTHRYQALVFDLDTLVDQDTGLINALQPLFARASAALTRCEMLDRYYVELARIISTFQTKSFTRLQALACLDLAGSLGVKVTTQESLVFSRSAAHWPLFDESRRTLQRLCSTHKVVILTRESSPPPSLLLKQEQLLSTIAIREDELGAWLKAMGLRAAQALHITCNTQLIAPQLDRCLLRRPGNKRYWRRRVAIDCLTDLIHASQHVDEVPCTQGLAGT